MAERGVFFTKESYPFFEEVMVEFPWFGGHSLAQKQRCIFALELNLKAAFPNRKLCEVSSASPEQTGRSLSAMGLSKRLNDGRKTTVESAFQSSRIYRDLQTGSIYGPFPELIMLPGRDAKKRVKELSRGNHSYSYLFEGTLFPAPDFHISLFYDYLFLKALTEQENARAAKQIIAGGYDTFSDLATKSLNTQARSCAIYVSLYHMGLLSYLESPESYFKLMRVDIGHSGYAAPGAYDQVQLLDRRGKISLSRTPVNLSLGKEEIMKAFAQNVLLVRQTNKSFIHYIGDVGFVPFRIESKENAILQ